MREAEFLDKDTGNKVKKTVVENIKRTHTHDHNMICCEVYNPSNEEITFTKQYAHLDGHPIIICKALGWCFLPHKYYIGSKKSGAPITVTLNYGKMKFKGNKFPSRPE